MKGIRTTPEEFWARVAKGSADECWLWMARREAEGYGRLRWSGRMMRASRIAYQLTFGNIAPGMCVCHRCDNPPCCNPTHLFLGTNRDNINDQMAKGRTLSGDANPARLHPDLLARGDRNGSRLYPERLCRGEDNHKAVLQSAQVIEIRARAAAGRVNKNSLAREYGVTPSTIQAIIRRRIWKHIP